MSKRVTERIDYKILSSTGNKVCKPVTMSEDERPEKSTNSDTDINIWKVEAYAIYESIMDFLDENHVPDIMDSVDDLDVAIHRIEELRYQFRLKHRSLKLALGDEMYEAEFERHQKNIISTVKDYIIALKEARKGLRAKDVREKDKEVESKDKCFIFLHQEASRQISSVEIDILIEPTKLPDADVKNSQVLTLNLEKKLDGAWMNLTEMRKLNVRDKELDDINKKYNKIVISKNIFIENLNSEYEKREIRKKEKFKGSYLNFKLCKFSGYDSAQDIYTFQSEFEKMHLNITPSELLPDILKNNHLGEPALSLVKNVNTIDEIWERLKQGYGSSKILLKKKLADLKSVESDSRSRDPEKITLWMSRIIGMMKDLSDLAEKHKIEDNLYNSDAIDKILNIIGESRTTRWLAKWDGNESDDAEESVKDSWSNLIMFLEKDLKILQRKSMIFKGSKDKETTKMKKFDKDNKDKKVGNGGYHSGSIGDVKDNKICSICGKDDHVMTSGPGFTKLVQYFACEEFVKMSPAERFRELRSKNLCYQCLFPGADWNTGKHKEGKCQSEYVCSHSSHDKFKRKKHILVCEEHKELTENAEILRKYKEKCIFKEGIPQFSKDIKLSFVTKTMNTIEENSTDNDMINKAIFQFQIIEVNGHQLLIFYDSGCSDFVVRYDAIHRLGSNTTLVQKPPLMIGGVGGHTTVSPYGAFSVKLPLCDGSNAHFQGVCLDRITETFPHYPLHGAVDQDISTAYKIAGGNPTDLPKLPKSVGGDVDLMIGVKYLRHYPEFVFQLPSGLTIYKSKFNNVDGSRGVIGGPHQIFSAMEHQFNIERGLLSSFICDQERLHSLSYQVNPDIHFLDYKHGNTLEEKCDVYGVKSESLVSRSLSLFDNTEEAGSMISYRCIKCRSCKDCKHGDQIEAMSFKEEVEQDLIKNSVKIDLENGRCSARLPFIKDPVKHLVPNKHKALRVYYQQLKKLKNNEADRNEIISSEAKLQKLGYVEYMKNLNQEDQDKLRHHVVQNFIPWRVVWKTSSITSPCRLVFDASQPTDSGKSLNEVLAKGRNNMNKLQEIFIRWRSHRFGYHTDVQKMYNSVELNKEDWCYQRYLWNESLNPDEVPEEKVIKTMIYGVTSSGNISEECIRRTASKQKTEFPEVNETVRKNVYVDDCFTGESTEQKMYLMADKLEIVMCRGGFKLKGFTFSGKPPLDILSDDKESIFVAGMKWFSETDELSFNVGVLNFSKKRRGRKLDAMNDVIPERITRRHCVSKVAEIFDLCGNLTPITSAMKLDLHDLVIHKLNWDDVLPDNLRNIWISNFEMMQEIGSLRYKRAIVPDDAANLEITTLDFGDASKKMACVAIYARFMRTNGMYSCQLILGRSKLVPDNMSQPRAELFAAVLNTHSGEVVRRALNKVHKGHKKMSDSQVALYWLKCEDRPLNQWVKNRVIEVRRLTKIEDWMFVDSSNMIADLGTRRGCSLQDVNVDSTWINGFPWMQGDFESFQARKIDQMTLADDEICAVRKEMPSNNINLDNPVDSTYTLIRYVYNDTAERYKFSNYLMDPNKYKFSRVVRIMALVFKYISKLKERIKLSDKPVLKNSIFDSQDVKKIIIDERYIQSAVNYFYRLATAEIKHFHEKKFKNLVEKEGILYYSGRLLPDEVSAVKPISKMMKDLTSTMFVVPAVDKHSPISYAVVSDIHWNHPVVKHTGIETTWRYVLKKVFIMEGRDVVKRVKKSCERCRYLMKKSIDVAMGPLQKENLTIAPAFYFTQIDLAGPYLSRCQHNKRATIKIWLIVFVCMTTTATKIQVMEDYSTTAFIQSFIRFACNMGYPKKMFIDEGSQLMKGCDDMRLNFFDIKHQLQKDVGVEFEPCPVGGHNYNGRVERTIKEVKKSIQKDLLNERLSIIQWETLSAMIANTTNDLPLGLRNYVSDFEVMDLITPNRLLLGRNNDRSPSADMITMVDGNKVIEENANIFECWFQNWLLCCVPNLIDQPKWYKTEHEIKVGDVVLITKDDRNVPTYQYGIVKSVQPGSDGLIRKAVIRYRNANENTDRVTTRAVRSLIIIHMVDEVNILEDLYQMSHHANIVFNESQ